ncbi:MAG TPA: hypothetical protein VJL58_09830, partial [Pyrinomonadaceae bacterium]|nr:hypothetical protein [Pyrinomonadaceae bacterium]
NNVDVFSADLKRNEMPSERYKKNAYKVAQRQLVEAGYRMGDTLNAIFGASSTAAAVDCRVIRKIMYPIHKLRTPENIAKEKATLVLLNTCPSGPAARPTLEIEVAGVKRFRTFDVVRTFETEVQARVFATQNSIKDVKFDLQ